MEKPNLDVFRAYDIRGIWGKDFDASFAQRLATRVTDSLKAGTVIIGRDGRTSSEELSYALADGAVHTGARVIDIGRVSTPQLAWAIRELNAVGGLMATASHNPPEYNGVKVIARHDGGLEVVGGHRLRQMYDSHPHNHRPAGSLTEHDVIPAYAHAVAKAAGWRGREIAAAVDAPLPVRQALATIADIAPDGDLAARFDADGDRIVFHSDSRPVPPDYVFLLLQESLGLAPVVLDLRFSRVVTERLTDRSVPYHISAVGRSAMTENMRRYGAALGGEMSGHYYWKSFADMESPELVLLSIIKILDKSGKKLSELIAPYHRYEKSEEINLPIRDHKAAASALSHVASAFRGAAIDRTDGISADMWDSQGWWFNLRPSNTEPLLRLVVEAKGKDLLDTKIAEVRKLLLP